MYNRNYFNECDRDEWTGNNGHGERIRNPEAYYQAVREDRYGFNSDYTLDQYDKYQGGNSSRYDHDEDYY